MRLNPLAEAFIPGLSKNSAENQSDHALSQHLCTCEDFNFSQLFPFGSLNYSPIFNSNLSKANDLLFPSSLYLNGAARSNASYIFISNFLEPRERLFELLLKDLLRILDGGFNTINIIKCINCIGENSSLSFTEKRSLLDKISYFKSERSKLSNEKINIFEIIKNVISNKKISIRIDEFLNEITLVEDFTELQFINMIKIVIETERFDSVSLGLVFYAFKKYSFDVEILNHLIKFSIGKLRENSIKNTERFIEFLEILINGFKINENSISLVSLHAFITNDLELYYMGYNLGITFFISTKFIIRNATRNMMMKYIELLFYTCANFDVNFSSSEFLQKYLYVTKSYLIKAAIKNNPNLRNLHFFEDLLETKIEDEKFTNAFNNMVNEENPDAVKCFLIDNLKFIFTMNYFSIKSIFDYCIRNNFFEIAAQLVEKLHFIYSCDSLSDGAVKRIFNARNLNGDDNNLIDEKSIFFFANFKHLKYEHLNGYSFDRLSKIFENLRFIMENYNTRSHKIIIHSYISKSLDPSYLKKYLRSVYEGWLENIICPLIENFIENNLRETDIFVQENNIFHLLQAVISLPISNYRKISFLNSCNLSPDKEAVFVDLLNNILPYEQALDQLVDILHLGYNFNESVRRTYELLK